MAADGNLKAAEFIRDALGENPQYKVCEKRLEYLIADKENSSHACRRVGRLYSGLGGVARKASQRPQKALEAE